MRHFSWRCAAAALTLLAASLAHAADAPQWRYSGVERVVAVGDIHGAYSEFVSALQAAGIVDADLNWSAGKTHLVSMGDAVARGPGSRKVLDLLMKLDEQAAAAGGKVQFVIGNHEFLTLTGNDRDVTTADYASFDAEETTGQRDREFVHLRPFLPRGTGARKVFDDRFPIGYFARRAAFSSNGVYGQWLLSHNVLLVINDSAFVHGGLSGMTVEHDASKLNDAIRVEMIDYITSLEKLVDAGWLPPDALAEGNEEVLNRGLSRNGTYELTTAAQRLKDLLHSELLDSDGPLWYRGNAMCQPLWQLDYVRQGLQQLGVKRLLIGHTPTVSGRVTSRFGGLVIKTDAGMLEAVFHGRAAATIIEGESVQVVYAREPTPQPVPPEDNPFLTQSNAEIEKLLATTSVEEIGAPAADGWRPLMLSGQGFKIRARFRPESPGNPGWEHEIAAHRLDRLLDLEMVPVTIEREIEGVRGALQLVIGATPASEARKQGLKFPVWCDLEAQDGQREFFDALIGLAKRSSDEMDYSKDYWMLLLSDNARAFATSATLPSGLKADEVTNAARDALGRLSDAALRDTLGSLLSAEQLAALKSRRDAILALK